MEEKDVTPVPEDESPHRHMFRRREKVETTNYGNLCAPKRQTCPKCQHQAKRTRKTPAAKNMPALAWYRCRRCKHVFEVKLARQ